MPPESLSNAIIKLRKYLRFSQSELAEELGMSAMAVSRWERGQGRPDGTTMLRLGILAQADHKLCWNFWNFAGLAVRDVVRVLPIAQKRLRRSLSPPLKIVRAGPRHRPTNADMVAIPFLSLVVAAGKELGSHESDFSRSRTGQLIAAPRLWCPNPAETVCLRVKGNSMEPTLFSNYMIVVDEGQTDRKKLNGKLIVAHHEKYGLIVSRLWQMAGSQALIPDNRTHPPEQFSAGWRISGKVLWWIGDIPGELQ